MTGSAQSPLDEPRAVGSRKIRGKRIRDLGLLTGALVLLTIVAYGPSSSFLYVQDSYHAVKINPVVERGDLFEIFTSHYWKDTVSRATTLYRPVTVLSFAIERALTGEASPAASHRINVLLHLAVVLLVWRYARRIGLDPLAARVAALIFTVHPVLLQAVVNVVGRADVLATLFSLAALLAMSHSGPWRGEDAGSPGRRRLALWGAAAFLFLALGSKEIAIATPLLLVAQQLLFGGRSERSGAHLATARAATVAAILLVGLVWLHLRTVAIGEFPGTQTVPAEDNVLVGMQGLPRVATTLAMAGRYASLLVWPSGLSPDYSGAAIPRASGMGDLLALVGLVFLASLVALAVVGLRARREDRRGHRARAMAALLFLLPYLTFGNLLVLNAAGFAERFLYLGAVGIAFVMADLLIRGYRSVEGRLDRRLRVAAAVALALALVFSALYTRGESRMWQNNRTMFARAAEVSPRSLRPFIVMASEARASGDLDRALEIYSTTLENVPDFVDFRVQRATLLAQRGDSVAAEHDLREALRLEPGHALAHMVGGSIEARRGRFVEADRSWRRALLHDPGLIEAAVQLGDLRFRSGRFAEAERYYDAVVRRGRSDVAPRLAAARRALEGQSGTGDR